jgi:adenylate cyclase
MQKKLAAILSADVVGYSRLMERDEAGTLARLKENRTALFEPCVAAHGGRVFKLMGDGVLIEFSSAASAVTCALEIQRGMEAGEPHLSEADRLRYRMGINLGDVIIEGDDIYGEGVNVAARLQALAPVGGIAVSRNVSDQVTGKVAAEFDDLGPHSVKNIERPVHVFAVRAKSAGAATMPSAEKIQRMAVCVLPFANMSGDPEQEYFADGISEDIITDLSKVSALWVAARNTAFTFKGKHVDVPQVARQLKVSHVVEGSVRKSGNRVRITAQLIDATGGHIWAERYDRELNDIFALQDEITEAIVKVLRVKLLPEEKKAIEQRGTTSVEAYKYYLLAREFYASGNDSKRMSEAILRLAQRCVELDPNYAEAWLVVARTHERLRVYGGSYDGSSAVERALTLDDQLAEGYAIRALIRQRRGQLEDAERDIARALVLGPDDYRPIIARAHMYFNEGRLREAADFYERATELNNTTCVAPGLLASICTSLGERERARRAAQHVVARAEKIVTREPDNCTTMSWLVAGLTLLGETDRSREWMNRALILDPENLNMRYNFACCIAVDPNQHEQAIELLKPSFTGSDDSQIQWMKVDPDLNPLRNHPRFKEMMAAAEARVAATAK